MELAKMKQTTDGFTGMRLDGDTECCQTDRGEAEDRRQAISRA